jgi:hypothetical protein
MMKMITMLALLIGVAVITVPLLVLAQCLDVTPASRDYGDVKVGTGETHIFTLDNCEDTEVFVETIEITDDDIGAFHITSAPVTPFFIPGSGSAQVEVTFTPQVVGPHGALLYIRSDDPRERIFVDLFGAGVKRWRCFSAKVAP